MIDWLSDKVRQWSFLGPIKNGKTLNNLGTLSDHLGSFLGQLWNNFEAIDQDDQGDTDQGDQGDQGDWR